MLERRQMKLWGSDMTKEIGWTSPVVGKLEVGKTYTDRKGDKHVITKDWGDKVASVYSTWEKNGDHCESEVIRHVLDLISEYQPSAPLKMWMNVYTPGDSPSIHGTEQAAIVAAGGLVWARIAVPVTITEGH